MDESKVEALITPRTKAIVPVHYAGVACDMHPIMELANKYGLFVIEDAAQAIDSYYTFPEMVPGNPLEASGICQLSVFTKPRTSSPVRAACW